MRGRGADSLGGRPTAAPGRRAAGAIMLAVALAGIVLAAILAGGASAKGSNGLCSQIDKLGLTKQMNMHAWEILARCGRAPARPVTLRFSAVARLTPASPLGTDVDLSASGEGTYPKVTQSETFNAVNGNTVVSMFNDSRTAPSCFSGGAYSVDGGATFTNLNAPRPFCTGHGTNYGSPIIVYNLALGLFFAGDLVSGCGGQGIGLWTSPDGITWSAGSCAHSDTANGDDRESMAVDNNPASPHYGRMYISFNTAGSGALEMVHSDNGTGWGSPVTVHATFIRDVQLTVARDGDVFLAGMDEGGGHLSPEQNHMFVSTTGGTSFTDNVMGPTFPAAGESTCFGGYFGTMFSASPFWRDMGGGNPGASIGNVVNYVFTQHGAGADVADVMYTRSIDNGFTWSAPVKIDGDGGTRKNWRPAISQSPKTGEFLITWYDQRATTGNDYQLWGRRSTNNGASFGAPFQISDATSPLPQQNDGSINVCYAGDYDMPAAQNYAGREPTLSTRHFVTWVDGRVALVGTNGAPYSYLTSTSNWQFVGGGTDRGNHCDDCVTSITLPFPEEQYGSVFFTVNASSNGTLQFGSASTAFTHVCLPTPGFSFTLMPYWADQLTTNVDPSNGIFTQTIGFAPNRDFFIRWHTTFFSGGGTAQYEVILHENSNVETVVYGATRDSGLQATAGIQLNEGHATQFSCDTASLTNGLSLDYNPTGPPVPPGAIPQQDVFLDKIG